MTSQDTLYINPQLLALVSGVLQAKSQWPDKATLVWLHCLGHFDHKTGRITQTPSEMAKETELDPKTMSAILDELVSFTLLERQEYADTTRYYLHQSIVETNRKLAGIESESGDA